MENGIYCSRSQHTLKKFLEDLVFVISSHPLHPHWSILSPVSCSPYLFLKSPHFSPPPPLPYSNPLLPSTPTRSLLIHSCLLSFILQVAPSPGSSLQNANLIVSPPTSNSRLHMALRIGFKVLCGCLQLTPQTPLCSVPSATQTSQPLRFAILPPCTGPFRTCFFLCLEHSSLPSHLANTNSCFWSELNQLSYRSLPSLPWSDQMLLLQALIGSVALAIVGDLNLQVRNLLNIFSTRHKGGCVLHQT